MKPSVVTLGSGANCLVLSVLSDLIEYSFDSFWQTSTLPDTNKTRQNPSSQVLFNPHRLTPGQRSGTYWTDTVRGWMMSAQEDTVTCYWIALSHMTWCNVTGNCIICVETRHTDEVSLSDSSQGLKEKSVVRYSLPWSFPLSHNSCLHGPLHLWLGLWPHLHLILICSLHTLCQ